MSTFYHDKANWQDAYTKVLSTAPAAVGSGALCRHQHLPGGGARLAPHTLGAGHLHLVVGLPHEGPGRRRPRRRRDASSGRSTPTPGSTARRSPRPTPSTARSTASPISSPTGRCSTTRRSSPITASPRPRPGRSSRRPLPNSRRPGSRPSARPSRAAGRPSSGSRSSSSARTPTSTIALMNGEAKYTDPEVETVVQDLEGLDRQGLLHRPVDRLRHGRHQRHGERVRQGQARHDPGRHLVRGDASGSRHVARRHRRLHHAQPEGRHGAGGDLRDRPAAPCRQLRHRPKTP